MSINFYKEIGKDRKIVTVKHPINKDDGRDWEYVIVDKDNAKKIKDTLSAGKMKDIKTILENTLNMIKEAKNEKNTN